VLRLAQPSVSTRIAALERNVGLQLFARSTRGVTLTAAGRALEPYARRCLDLAAHRLAIHSWGPGATELDEILRTSRIPPTRVCWVSPAATALTLAAEHGYIAMLPADTAYPGLHSGVLAQVRMTNLPRWSMNVAVAYRHGFAERQTPKIMQTIAETGTKITGIT
jgi:DNA-binding transcriptional LysR family regulator